DTRDRTRPAAALRPLRRRLGVPRPTLPFLRRARPPAPGLARPRGRGGSAEGRHVPVVQGLRQDGDDARADPATRGPRPGPGHARAGHRGAGARLRPPRATGLPPERPPRRPGAPARRPIRRRVVMSETVSTPPARPADFCRGLLAALDASEGRRRRRKRDTTPDAIGLAIKRELLE